MLDEGRWIMQENRRSINKALTEPQSCHKLNRMANPYLVWLCVLAVLPMLVLFFMMFLDIEGINFNEFSFTFTNFESLNNISIGVAFFNSFKYSIITTIICLFFGYLIAYAIYRSNFKHKYTILLLLVLPMWVNILLRIEALGNMFKPFNMITNAFPDLFPNGGMNIMGTDVAIILGMVFSYLPFVILPIYTSLEKIDPSLDDAALDLGMTKFKKFWTVTFPLSTSGMVSGSIMVLLPCLSGFAIPNILGQGNVVLVGTLIETDFTNMSYNVGAMLAVILLVIIIGAIMLVNKFDKEGETLL